MNSGKNLKVWNAMSGSKDRLFTKKFPGFENAKRTTRAKFEIIKKPAGGGNLLKSDRSPE